MPKFFKWLEGAAAWIGIGGGGSGGARKIPPATVKAAADAVVAQASADIGVLVTKASSGLMTVADMEPSMQQAIRRGIIANGALAHGGYDRLTPQIIERLEKQVLAEHDFLRKRIVKVQSNVRATGQMSARDSQTLVSYANKFRTVYENERLESQRGIGHTEARRVLAAVQHCESCQAIADEGWMPIDEMPPIGSDDCKNSCHCIIISRRGGED